MPPTPKFGTVLVRRKANEQPSDWELRLRPICHKIRVVEKLLGGAHLMLTGATGIAVRIYSADDARRLEAAGSCNDADPEGVDGLRNFRDSFEHSVVFFVLPSGQQQRDQLGRRESFVSTAQKSLLRWDNEAEGEGKKKRITRTVVVSDIQQVINTIDSFAQSLTSEKREKRRKYFAQVANKNLLPLDGMEPTKEVIANHVKKTFNEWAERFEMPEGDSSVVLSMLGSLANVATADASTLDDVPIRNASKELVSRFFGADNAEDSPAEEDEKEALTNDDELEFGDIDDAEFLECPDPSYLDRSEQQTQDTPFQNIFQTTAKKQVVRNNDFTPMVPTRLHEQPGYYDATPSIFPDSFAGQMAQSSTRGSNGYMRSTGYGNNAYGAGASANAGFSSSMGAGSGNYHHSYQDANDMHGYQHANYGHGGYYAHPHQQFM